MQLFLNIWDPSLGTYGNHSISQMWVVNDTGGTIETAEVGLTVDHGLFNDYNNHLFIYWTDDDYGSTGCYDLTCTGFVQTNNSVTLGGYYSPVSTTTGSQYYVELSWEKSSSTANWWLLYQGTTWIGYYPTSQYHHGMQTQASQTKYGGEVEISAPNGSQLTQMGAGAFASSGATYAAFQSHLQYINTNCNTVDVSPTLNYTGLPSCYSLSDRIWLLLRNANGPAARILPVLRRPWLRLGTTMVVFGGMRAWPARGVLACAGNLSLLSCATGPGAAPGLSTTSPTTDSAPGSDGTYLRGVYTCCGPGRGVSCCTADAGLLGYALDGAVFGGRPGQTEANCFQYGGTAGACYDNGAMFDAKDVCALCCSGLERVNALAPNDAGTGPACLLVGPPSAMTCVPCGNRICDPDENSCTCPADCD